MRTEETEKEKPKQSKQGGPKAIVEGNVKHFGVIFAFCKYLVLTFIQVNIHTYINELIHPYIKESGGILMPIKSLRRSHKAWITG